MSVPTRESLPPPQQTAASSTSPNYIYDTRTMQPPPYTSSSATRAPPPPVQYARHTLSEVLFHLGGTFAPPLTAAHRRPSPTDLHTAADVLGELVEDWQGWMRTGVRVVVASGRGANTVDKGNNEPPPLTTASALRLLTEAQRIAQGLADTAKVTRTIDKTRLDDLVDDIRDVYEAVGGDEDNDGVPPDDVRMRRRMPPPNPMTFGPVRAPMRGGGAPPMRAPPLPTPLTTPSIMQHLTAIADWFDAFDDAPRTPPLTTTMLRFGADFSTMRAYLVDVVSTDLRATAPVASVLQALHERFATAAAINTLNAVGLRTSAYEVRDVRQQIGTLMQTGILINDRMVHVMNERANADLVQQWQSSVLPDVFDVPLRTLADRFLQAWSAVFRALADDDGDVAKALRPQDTSTWDKVIAVLRALWEVVGVGDRLVWVGLVVVG